MKKSWREFIRRVATTCLIGVTGSSAWTAAVCYAIDASDNASDPVYADGWQEGDNGGTGFTAWNFDGTYASTVQQRIDNGARSGALGSSTFNDVGRAWSLFNPVEEGGGGQRDVARAGRGFAPLVVGQTLKVVIDNPSEELFFRGYFVRLSGNTGGVNGNICFNGTACSAGAMPKQKMRFEMFEYFTYGQWFIGNEFNIAPTGLYNADAASPPQVGTNSGVRLEVKLTGAETVEAKIIPLDNVGATFTHTGTLSNPGFSIDWIEFLHLNTQSTLGFDSDFFIRSMEIVDEVADDADFDGDGDGDVDGGDFLKWQRGVGLTGQTNNSNGDANGDGSVGAADLSVWKTQFGVGPLAAAGAAIPEPTCFTLLIAAGAVSIRFRKRH